MATLLNLPLSSPIISDMSADEVEMTYAFYMERENMWWRRFERVIGTTWYYEDVVPMVSEEKKETKDEPTLLGPGQRMFMPLTMALNPAMYKEVKSRFGSDSNVTVLGDGEVVHGESLFSLPKEEYLKRMGSAMRSAGTIPRDKKGIKQDSAKDSRSVSPDTPLRKNPPMPKPRR